MDDDETFAKIITPVATRWNSVTMMIESVMKMRRTLSSIRDNPGQDDGNLAEVIPTEEDFKLFEECLDAMLRVAEVSEALSTDNYLTINRVMSFLYDIQSTCQKKLSLSL